MLSGVGGNLLEEADFDARGGKSYIFSGLDTELKYFKGITHMI